MSYCHIASVGINFSLGFGAQPKGVITSFVNNGSCLASCTPCPNDLTIASPITSSQNLQANNSVVAYSTISNNLVVQYKAGSKVDLTPGFYVSGSTNSMFNAFINSCGSNFFSTFNNGNGTQTTIPNSWTQSAPQDINNSFHLNIYPNPAQNELNLDIRNISSPTLEISKIYILKMGQTRPQLVYFRSIHKTDIAQI